MLASFVGLFSTEKGEYSKVYVHSYQSYIKRKKKNKTTTSTALTVSRLHLDGASHLKEEKQYRQDKGLVQAQETAVTI